MNDINTAEILERGMNCLLDHLGVVETERFISVMIREKFDYTKWRRSYFGDSSVEEINGAAAEYAGANPFRPAGAVAPAE